MHAPRMVGQGWVGVACLGYSRSDSGFLPESSVIAGSGSVAGVVCASSVAVAGLGSEAGAEAEALGGELNSQTSCSSRGSLP